MFLSVAPKLPKLEGLQGLTLLLVAALCFVVSYGELSLFHQSSLSSLAFCASSLVPKLCLSASPLGHLGFVGASYLSLIPIVIVCCWPMVFKLGFAPCWSKLDSTPRVGLRLPKLVVSRSGSDSGFSLSRSKLFKPDS